MCVCVCAVCLVLTEHEDLFLGPASVSRDCKLVPGVEPKPGGRLPVARVPGAGEQLGSASPLGLYFSLKVLFGNIGTSC